MNSNTYAQMATLGLIAPLQAQGPIHIDESIPDGLVVRTETLDVAELKRREEAKYYGGHKTRSGYTKVGMQARDKAKAKASRAARKRNRK
jgi:hypothetical protein